MPCSVSGTASGRRRPSPQHPRVLLGEERDAAGVAEQRRLRLGREHAAVEQRLQQPRGVLVRERRERDRLRVALAAAPAGPPLEQLGARGADDEQRHAGDAVDELVDEVEQPVVGPVQVLEHEHGRATLGQRLEEAAPRRDRLARAGRRRAVAGAEPDERPQVPLHPAPLAVVRERRSATARRELRRRATSAESDSRIPACALTISPSAQKATPSPYGSDRPWRQVISSASASTTRQSSCTSRLLPIPGTPTSVTSCGSRSRAHALERVA